MKKQFVTVSLPSQHRGFEFKTMESAAQWLVSFGGLEKAINAIPTDAKDGILDDIEDTVEGGADVVAVKNVLRDAYNLRSVYGDNYFPLSHMRWVRRNEMKFKLTQSASLVTTKTKVMNICSICLVSYVGYGHNAHPVNSGKCCGDCNRSVLLARLAEDLIH